MNIVDIILAVLLFYGLIRGFFNGFISELASLIALVLGVYGAIYFSHAVSDLISNHVSWNTQVIYILAFIITFIIIVFVISLAAKMLTGFVNLVFLGIINKILGAIFGLLKIAFIISVLIMFFSRADEQFDIIDDETLEGSVLYPIIQPIGPALLPKILHEVKDGEIFEDEGTEDEIKEVDIDAQTI